MFADVLYVNLAASARAVGGTAGGGASEDSLGACAFALLCLFQAENGAERSSGTGSVLSHLLYIHDVGREGGLQVVLP